MTGSNHGSHDGDGKNEREGTGGAPSLNKGIEQKIELIQYVDDATDHRLRIKPKDRYGYFKFLLDHNRKDNYIEKVYIDEDILEKTFSIHLGRIFTLLTSKVLDFIYLICIFLVIAINGLLFDQLLPIMIGIYIDYINIGLLFLAVTTQIIPIVGMIYFMIWYNYKVQYRAEREISDWVSVYYIYI